jgi:hypothetical protein
MIDLEDCETVAGDCDSLWILRMMRAERPAICLAGEEGKI